MRCCVASGVAAARMCAPGAARRAGAVWCLLALLLAAPCAAPVPAPAPVAVNWASAAQGATATANSAGYWAGYTALPAYALDDDVGSYWSSTGGAVCCSETARGWLLVALGALRPVAALQLLFQQDMTFSLSLGNASGGPFALVARRPCVLCEANADVDEVSDLQSRTSATAALQMTKDETFLLPATATASFVRLEITWSSQGGIGGCSDLCDWATNVFELRAWSARPPPPPPAPPPGLPSPPPPTACTPAVLASNSVLWRASAADAALTGAASPGAPGGGAHGTQRLDLTAATESRSGAAEFWRVIHPATDCICPTGRYLLLTIYVWLGGGMMPGEGLVISMVDATRQTPGQTVFMPGCGVRAALPAHAISIVFDSASSDVACDEPGTGTRLVSTLGGPDAAPQVLSATLDMRVSAFRAAAWVPLQFVVGHSAVSLFPSDADAAASAAWAPFFVFLNGTDSLRMASGASVLLSGADASSSGDAALSAFYVVASARTSDHASDAHAVSGLRLECGAKHDASERDPAMVMELFENWSGLTQPLTPPPRALPPRPLPPPPPRRGAAAGTARAASPAAAGAAAFGVALCGTLALLAGAAAAWRQLACRRAASRRGDDNIPLVAAPPAGKAAQADGVDVLLSYRAEDWRLADTVHDKLALHFGLRTRKEVAGGALPSASVSAGRLRLLRAAPVFAPLVTLPALQALAAANGDGGAAVLAEWLLALYFTTQSGGAREKGNGLRLVHPLLLGAEATDAGTGRRRWLSLLDDPACAVALAALPDAVSSAAVAAADAALRAGGAPPLPRRFASLTVRQIVLGRDGGGDADGALRGVLSGAPFALACAEEDLELYITRSYAAPIILALRNAA